MIYRGRHLEPFVRFTTSDRYHTNSQEGIPGLSFWIVPILLRYCVSFPKAFFPRLQLWHNPWTDLRKIRGRLAFKGAIGVKIFVSQQSCFRRRLHWWLNVVDEDNVAYVTVQRYRYQGLWACGSNRLLCIPRSSITAVPCWHGLFVLNSPKNVLYNSVHKPDHEFSCKLTTARGRSKQADICNHDK